MAQEEGIQPQRVFEQPADAISFYSDFTHILASREEVLLQLYETIPEPPGPGGHVQMFKTRLRATVMVSRPNARRIAELLLKMAGEE